MESNGIGIGGIGKDKFTSERVGATIVRTKEDLSVGGIGGEEVGAARVLDFEGVCVGR